MSDTSLQPPTPSISGRADSMPRSSIRRLFRSAKDLQDNGVNVLRLDIGDPNFDMPERISNAIKFALDNHHTHYSPMPGIPELRNAVARHMSVRLSGSPADCEGAKRVVSPENIICSQGATQALNACFQMVCDIGDVALLPDIYFPNYMQQLCLAGIKPAYYAFDDKFLPELDMLESRYQPGMKVMLVNSPSNPTGRVFDLKTVRALYEFAREHSMWIISDEAYMELVYDGAYISPMHIDLEYPENERRVLGVCSFSKGYAATGLRLGWTVCPNEEIANKLGLLNEPFTGSLTTPLQHGMVAALTEDDTDLRRDELKQRRDFAVGALREAGFDVPAPEGGIFVFLDISATGMDGDTFADKLLAEEHVSVVPGSGFGLQPSVDASTPGYTPGELAKRCVRLCYGAPADQLREGIRRFTEFAKRYSV